LAELAPALGHYEQLGISFAILPEGQSVMLLSRLALEEAIRASYAAYVLELLDADDEPRPISVPHTGVTITLREVQVLRLVVGGHSRGTNAEQPVINVWTVKAHLTKIYRALDVT
jgi:DNA-binding CsgD family transcriptional regulator